MKQLLMLMGPPASGKTTRAKQLLDRLGSMAVRVNQDEIRRQLGWASWESWDFGGRLEKSVYGIKASLIVDALQDPNVKVVISDDTNLKPARQRELQALADKHGAELVIERFDTPLDECLRRDALRPANEQVGEKVIRRMHAEMAPSAPFVPVRADVVPGLLDAIICDLDGTLADHEGRRGVYEFEKCADDALKTPIAAIVEQFWKEGPAARAQIIYMSGREERFRPQTMQFLRKYGLADAGPLYMRRTGDRRNDAIVKHELFDAHIRGKFNVLFCLDDRDRVVQLWREMGLTCLQVAPGAF